MQPPNEPPYEPSYQSPIPSPYTPPTSGAVPPQGPPQVNFDVISHAWEALKPTMGVWVGAYVIYLIISVGVSMIVGQFTGGGFTPPSQSGRAAPMPNIPLMVIGQFVNIAVSLFLMGGLYRLAINQVRTGTANLGDMFSVMDVLPNLFIVSILSTIAIFVGALFCILPGLLIGALLMFAIPLIVDQRMGAIDAMKASIEALKSQMWMALAFAIVIGILGSIGIVLCCVGLLVTGPLSILSTATLYRDFFPNKTLA